MLKREFKINFKGLIIWTIILLSVYILVFAIYPSIMNEETKEGMNQMIQSMPPEMLASFNMDIAGMETAYGWFKTEGYMFLTLIGGLYSSILGATILLKEESDKTIEFLYSKPVSRNKIVTSKIICGVINLFLFTLVITIVNGISLFKTEDFNIKEFLMISIIPILLYYLLFFIMMFISTFFKKTKKSMSIGIGIVFISYFMQIIGNMGENVEIIKNISLFEFASSRYIILNNAIDMKYLWLGLLIILITTVATYWRYNLKEFLI